MNKKIILLIGIFVLGGLSSCLVNYFWPSQSGPNYITQNTETTLYVQENLALRKLVEDALPAVAGVRTKTSLSTLLGSGLVLTSDGYLVTLASLVPQGSTFGFYVDNSWPAFQVLKRDFNNNLALIKVESSGLKTRGFADLAKIRLAEPVFLAAVDFSSTTPQNRVNAGIITYLGDNLLKTNIIDDQAVSGSPLLDTEGHVVGLSVVGSDGRVSAIPIDIIRIFSGF
jgi:serine protease Do